MSIFTRNKIKEPNVEECEHITGVALSLRKSLISFSMIAEKNIYAGIVIGQAFDIDIEALDDEFDALTLSYCWKILNAVGATESSFIKGASLVFDNFDISPEIRQQYGARFKDYDNLTDSEIGEKLLANIAQIYSGVVEKNDPKILANQLKQFSSVLRKNILNELSA